jgi:hypothetical protein
MTPTELKECLRLINWSQRRLATEIQCHERTVRRFVDGTYVMPEPEAAWLRKLAKFHKKYAPMYAAIAEFHAKNPPPIRPKKPAKDSSEGIAPSPPSNA